MGVEELSEAEQVVLLSLVGLMARADGSVSDSEMGALQSLREAIGPGRFERVRDAAAQVEGPAAIMAGAKQVTRPEARETVFAAIVELAAPDVIDENEAALIERLAELWGLASPFSE